MKSNAADSVSAFLKGTIAAILQAVDSLQLGGIA